VPSSNSSSKPSAADVCVYAPVGVASLAREFLPGFVALCVARGRSEFDSHQERVEEEMARARGIGQLAVAAAPGFVERQLRIARERATTALADLTTADRTEDAEEPETDLPEPSSNGLLSAVPDATADASDQLPIPDYDALAASQVVDRLSGLGEHELRAVRAYESTHRGRKTVLGRIDQLSV
jgi:hypothetical protein